MIKQCTNLEQMDIDKKKKIEANALISIHKKPIIEESIQGDNN